MKPKRVGTYHARYNGRFGLKDESHPVYEYRGFYIKRDYSVANSPSTAHYEIYREFKGTDLSEFDFHLNGNNGQKTLKAAVVVIDYYLENGY